MGEILQFRQKHKEPDHPLSSVATRPRRARAERLSLPPMVLTAVLACLAGCLYLFQPVERSEAGQQAQFTLCGSGPRINCVVDGDTFWFNGRKIRVAGVNTPETHRPECAREAELGERAARRFLDLLNAGPIALERPPGRDMDRYGRALRIVKRGGRSLGHSLVEEGLARIWTGKRRSWCI